MTYDAAGVAKIQAIAERAERGDATLPDGSAWLPFRLDNSATRNGIGGPSASVTATLEKAALVDPGNLLTV